MYNESVNKLVTRKNDSNGEVYRQLSNLLFQENWMKYVK